MENIHSEVKEIKEDTASITRIVTNFGSQGENLLSQPKPTNNITNTVAATDLLENAQVSNSAPNSLQVIDTTTSTIQSNTDIAPGSDPNRYKRVIRGG